MNFHRRRFSGPAKKLICRLPVSFSEPMPDRVGIIGAFAGPPRVPAVVVVPAADVAEVFRDAEALRVAGTTDRSRSTPSKGSTETRPPLVPMS